MNFQKIMLLLPREAKSQSRFIGWEPQLAHHGSPNVGAGVPAAALAAALGAWRVGTDVYTAVQQAGYGVEVAQGLYDYVNSRFWNEQETQEYLDATERNDVFVSLCVAVSESVRASTLPKEGMLL